MRGHGKRGEEVEGRSNIGGEGEGEIKGGDI